MGTNFYWAPVTEYPTVITFADGEERTIPKPEGRHIGKRSAAGAYCFDCDITLCMGGNSAIHNSRSSWHDACPMCGKTKPSPDIRRGAGAIELVFARPNEKRPTGIQTTSSFSWAIDPAEARHICEARMDQPCVVNEYGTVFTGAEFLRMLRANCAVQFTDSSRRRGGA